MAPFFFFFYGNTAQFGKTRHPAADAICAVLPYIIAYPRRK